MKLYDLIDEMALLVNNTTEDMHTMCNILIHINDNCSGVVPESMLGMYELGSPEPINKLDLLIRTSLEETGVDLTDDLFDSMIDGEVYEYYASKYVELYFAANKKIISLYSERWDDVQDFIKLKFINSVGGEG